ncbi:27031_t:CDS:2 [Dentiscutata erythropus]|uniref:27031_t:CDS:1 n=1 Tax=Dentiscutata erythropus TaxID=1348616 RepID=A0A9N9C2J2_9GLOM|nr:27031_t:CDS:2 [Dentiscutata erythropus]
MTRYNLVICSPILAYRFRKAITTYWKNKSSSHHVKSTNAASNEPIVLDNINQNQPTVDSSSNKTFDSSASNDNSILSSLNAQLKTETVNLHLNTTRQFLHLVQKERTKMEASSLLAESLGKGPCFWLQINQYLEKNKFKLAIPNFIRYVSSIMPTFGITSKIISRSTVRRWLKLLGWKYQTYTKKIYFNGHEHEDVVEDRNHFLQEMTRLRKQMAQYVGENLDCIIPSELYPEIVPVTQDETTLYTNDIVKEYWGPAGEYSLWKKSLGQSIHISDFFCESIGCLKLSEHESYINDLLPDYMRLKYTHACVAIYPGINHDGWWSGDDLVD